MRGANPQICCTFRPRPMATSLTLTIAEPCAAATFAVCDCPPSNWMMAASMQRLPKRPSALATYGDVCTTLGGATETPTLILRIVGQLGTDCADTLVAVSVPTSARMDSVGPRIRMIASSLCIFRRQLERTVSSKLVESGERQLRRLSGKHESERNPVGLRASALILLPSRRPWRDPPLKHAQQRCERDTQQPERHDRHEHLVDLVGARRAHDQIADARDRRI